MLLFSELLIEEGGGVSHMALLTLRAFRTVDVDIIME